MGSSFLSLNDKATVAAFGALAKKQGIQVNWPVAVPAILRLDAEFKIGKLSAEDFRSQVKSILNIKATDNEFDEAWNAMLGDTSRLLNQIRELKNSLIEQGISLILTTSSNPIHIAKLAIRDDAELAEVPFYISYEHQCMHQELYAKIVENENLEPAETYLVVPVAGVNLVPPAKERDEGVQTQICDWAEENNIHIIEYTLGKEPLTADLLVNALENKLLCLTMKT